MYKLQLLQLKNFVKNKFRSFDLTEGCSDILLTSWIIDGMHDSQNGDVRNKKWRQRTIFPTKRCKNSWNDQAKVVRESRKKNHKGIKGSSKTPQQNLYDHWFARDKETAVLSWMGKSWRFSSCSSSDGSPRASLDSSSHPTIYTYCILERASYTFFPRLPLIRDSSLLKRRTFDSRIECVSEREKESRETDITIYSFFSCRARIMTLFPYNPLIALKQANEHTRTEMKFMFSCETSSRTRGLVLCRDNFPLWDDNQLIRENNCRFQTIINRTL